VVREAVGAGGEMTQALYAHKNNKTIKIKIKIK
jgi:NaMN:DMB phosphoribosyltransferase